MAITFNEYNGARYHILNNDMSPVAGLSVMLLSDAYVFDAAHDVVADVSANEVSGTGYTAGGVLLANITVTQNTAEASLTADSALFSSVTVDFQFAVVYDSTNNYLISCLDWGALQSVSGDLQINWHADGIIVFSAPA